MKNKYICKLNNKQCEEKHICSFDAVLLDCYGECHPARKCPHRIKVDSKEKENN